MTSAAPDRDPSREILRLVGVYDADGTVRGELAYFVGARLGRAHCALCDITHGLMRERTDWQECRNNLPVPFDTYHRDDQPDDVRAVSGGVVPTVLAETEPGYVVLLGPSELDDCAGSLERFRHALEAAIARAGLTRPG